MNKIINISEEKCKIENVENPGIYGFIEKEFSKKRTTYDFKIEYFYNNIYQKTIYEDTMDDAKQKLISILDKISEESLKSFESYFNYKFNDMTDIFKHKETYIDKVFDNILNICMDEKGISEKSFKLIDDLTNEIKIAFAENEDVFEIIQFFEDNNKRTKFCAEYIYDRYFKIDN